MNTATLHRNYARAEAPDMSLEDCTPTIRAELSDAEVKEWIANFAETGDIADELGKLQIASRDDATCMRAAMDD